MKLGIIRCMQTEDYCPGTTDFKAIKNKIGAFADEDDIELVGFTNCGGCPGKRAVLRARLLKSRGVDTIAFASCISKGTPIGYPCPFAKRMKELVQKEVYEANFPLFQNIGNVLLSIGTPANFTIRSSPMAAMVTTLSPWM